VLPAALTADLVRQVASPAVGQGGSARLAVAAIVVQAGVDEVAAASLTELATQLADDVREILQGEVAGQPVSAAVVVSGPLAALDGRLAAQPAGRAAGQPAGQPQDATAGRRAAGYADHPDALVIDRSCRRVAVAGQSLELTYREFELLAFLADHPGQVFSRAQLLRTVWDHAPVGSRTVDVHVRRLRIKLGAEARLLTTVRNVGYRLEQRVPATVVHNLETVA
jgi:DNA-binding winged helix-turn-helix (wHTH) protein